MESTISDNGSDYEEAIDPQTARLGAERLKAMLGDLDILEFHPKISSTLERPEPSNEGNSDTYVGGETYSFRLFASPKDSNDLHDKSIQRITLESETNDLSTNFRYQRPQNFYIVDNSPYIPTYQLRESAIDGTKVLEMSKPDTPRPGLMLPWKAVVGSKSAIASKTPKIRLENSETPSQPSLEQGSQRRCRKGKKTRIKIRMRLRASKQEMQNLSQSAATKTRKSGNQLATSKAEDPLKVSVDLPQIEKDAVGSKMLRSTSMSKPVDRSKNKEEHLMEKKKRLNRKKQLRRREKARKEKELNNIEPSLG